jgi:phosphoglycerol transferase MdoB-like AlkP superfamily enzyme
MISSAPTLAASTETPAVRSRIGGWLVAHPTLGLIAAGVLLPNVLSLVTLLFDIGLPPRSSAIPLYVAAALCARLLPFPLVVAAFLAALAYDLVSTVALLFGLAPSEIVVALRHAGIVRIYASPLYLSLLGAITVTTAAALALLHHRQALRQASLIPVIAAALGVAVVDLAVHASPHYHFGSLMGHGKQVQSASEASGFTQAVASGRNVILIVVEGMGKLVDPTKRAAIAEPLAGSAVTARYRVMEGSVEYFGSTTAAEMREFCATRDAYSTLTAESGTKCLPARLRRAGYETIAIHGFSGGMFERASWYPLVGFDRSLFAEDLFVKSDSLCGSVFRGMCDSRMEPQLTRQLHDAGKPVFLYWLTLNTHVPVNPGDVKTSYLGCGRIDNSAERDVCLMAELWRDVFATVAHIATDPSLASAEILIVGDHAPPLWSMRGRRMFEPGQVAWYRLTPR